MTGYLRFDMDGADDVSVLVESEGSGASFEATQPAGVRDRLADGIAVAASSFEAAIGRVLEAHARTFVGAIRGLSDPPAEAELSFGLKAAGEAGNFVITKVAGEMNYGIRLLWRPQQPSPVIAQAPGPADL